MKARMTKSAKLARALVLRDAALTVVRRMGVWEAVGIASRATSGAGDMKLLSARMGGLHISYRTPFQQIPQADDAFKYRAGQLGLTVPQNLPYGLDVYTTKKVLNIEWDDKGNVVLVSLHPGAWETELIKLAKSKYLDRDCAHSGLIKSKVEHDVQRCDGEQVPYAELPRVTTVRS
jgi:hypothetical protein